MKIVRLPAIMPTLYLQPFRMVTTPSVKFAHLKGCHFTYPILWHWGRVFVPKDIRNGFPKSIIKFRIKSGKEKNEPARQR